MSVKENRDIVIERVRKEIIGPGSDLFHSKKDFSDEIIEGKPLQRYFSGILFPKREVNGDVENPEGDTKDEDNQNDDDNENNNNNLNDDNGENNPNDRFNDDD